jgi:hypothetical protein
MKKKTRGTRMNPYDGDPNINTDLIWERDMGEIM